ncbi:NUDIX domain protein [Hartmannibacter diazotrophicus]|uniref:NUDIX domain protein n=1 Tax=Hartmannibacter diazotrophicus TaxID=1482074 RepID=A0A2C9D7N4_9HYPH|nr:NUDIX hydrolase [Hartmannibacter diazotrophicus]SON56148.1 NUDIX domain protein [Hartmannibacter diazotrophicus]
MKKKAKKKLAPKTMRRQVAALPICHDESGNPRVLLISSRETQRPVIPKGWQMKGKPDHLAAEIEAFEEAGVKGRISKKPVGTYRYWKRLSDQFALVDVDVYALEVAEHCLEWPEQEQRQARWFSPEDAALLIDEPLLAALIRRLV